ncbi:polysaccharide biosynthesis protein [Bariatricus massiliensis]|uniref:Polysaccharide biosynthesis protein n=1 Tax=Bariatricus massiliensis TaxID=1745713 RepID=A0ABS8DIW1_9FIRM|nr:nucleoside-diphosphate sugar epimerase/dehydratase [Bariatricus massiliensis]MCB7305220.1 polysaccharide biosynthesis protein [Bariatricus massiliensis]MCB7375672.1 polysaccharide biosynthesis protein [Bariatricus massiliensis]MCB7388363.1 polysaccharide biosynthesis protein [Bariatricus massiliensis]MCB7412434.1 polysaccharide biosynthesis protein [Bariatricus massiliensis]MCQ5254172.1 polysaccharide biosynthesis protein [Bariatricus massiliensis]
MKRIINLRSSRTRMFILSIVDIITIIVNSYLSLLIRHELHYDWIPHEYIHDICTYMVINIITTIIIFILMNLYRSVWTFAGLHEAILIVGACVLSTAFQALGMTFLVLQVPRSYYVYYCFLLILTTMVTRFSYRGLRIIRKEWGRTGQRAAYNTMVIGAGEAGSIIINELKTSGRLSSRVVCVIDDNPSKKGKYLHGVRIVGDRSTIVHFAEKYDVNEIILAIPSAKAKDTKEILRICNQTNCKLKVLPGMYQFITGEVTVSKLRDVSIDDLLGRDAINIDLDSVAAYIKGKTVLITGGGGSIGSELCRQIAAYGPHRLIVFDIYENNAYDIQQELKKKYPELQLEVLIGSVRNTKRIETVMEYYRPDVVYHAAAHKHVPLMEDSPNEAIKNNVFGTYKTARAADKYGVKRFVLISTDKAVNPTNIMGASKRMCEMVIQTFNRYSSTEYVAVRFGNVLGSNGSVIPLFKKQMLEGGPVTVTHPDIIRYFMTIPEAVSLVLQAGAFANGGEIFVLDMGEPVKIADLAKNLIRLSGYTLGVDMDIVYTGLRPGEKLYEEILTEEEGLQKTKNDLIYIGKPLEFDEVHFLSELKKLEQAAIEESWDIKQIVSGIIPTYHIRPEDQKRDEETKRQLCNLGKFSHEGPVVEE